VSRHSVYLAPVIQLGSLTLTIFAGAACALTNTPPSGERPLVTGEIVFEGEGQSFSGATAYVRLEDVTQADAPAKTVAEQVINNVSYQAGGGARLPFTLTGDLPGERRRYAVRVHVDVDGDGQVGRGDYISMESYPVLTFGSPSEISVRVREVR
jgi:uncharacterized lipoprotein YbaY